MTTKLSYDDNFSKLLAHSYFVLSNSPVIFHFIPGIFKNVTTKLSYFPFLELWDFNDSN